MLSLDEVIEKIHFYLTLLVEGVLAVARAFGDIDFKDKKSYGAGAITCEPEIKIWNITEKTEFIVLACDGLWDVFSNGCVANFVRRRLLIGKTPQSVCESLVKYAYQKGSRDNISAVIVSFLDINRCKNNPQLIDIPINDDNITNRQEKSCDSDSYDDNSSDNSHSPKSKKKKDNYFNEGVLIDAN
jgi:serine/threonine protein phosphatase PrpC